MRTGYCALFTYGMFVALVMGCGTATLAEGTYELEMDEVLSETCGLSDEEYGVGEAELIKVHWEDDTLVFTGAGDAEGTYAWDGDSSFEVSYSETSEIDGTSCAVRVDRELLGTILSKTSFEVELQATLSIEGDCSAVDTTGFPCSVVLLYRGELVE